MLRRRDFSTLMTQSGPDAPAQSVGRVARLSGNVRQPNHVLANEIAGHKAERRPRAGEEWLAATKYDGVEVKSILINKGCTVAQALNLRGLVQLDKISATPG